MAKYKQGDIWSELGNSCIIFITTNSVTNKKGDLVMGAGSAKQAKDRFPKLPKIWGKAVRQFRDLDYHIIITEIEDNIFVGALQTKRDWKASSPKNLVIKSLKKLQEYAKLNPTVNFHSVMPGINHGKLNIQEVKPYTDLCPDNITFWQL